LTTRFADAGQEYGHLDHVVHDAAGGDDRVLDLLEYNLGAPGL